MHYRYWNFKLFHEKASKYYRQSEMSVNNNHKVECWKKKKKEKNNAL